MVTLGVPTVQQGAQAATAHYHRIIGQKNLHSRYLSKNTIIGLSTVLNQVQHKAQAQAYFIHAYISNIYVYR